MIDWNAISENAVRFSAEWKIPEGPETRPARRFMAGLLACLGLDAEGLGAFGWPAGQGAIDYLWPGMLAMGMKSPGETALGEAKDRLLGRLKALGPGLVPKYLLVSDFADNLFCRLSPKTTKSFRTAKFPENVKLFAEMAGHAPGRVHGDRATVNARAAVKMARLHDALKGHGYDGRELEVYLVRLLFCLFAGDTGIFPKNGFRKYVEDSRRDGSDLSVRMAKLFETLNLPEENRAKRTLLPDELKQFRYINGNMFRNILPSAEFNAKTRRILLDCATFDWGDISPAIFGAMFQGVMGQQKRREIGAHYTGEENILKVINPLFLEGLWAEFDKVKLDRKALKNFHDKISRLRFLDPACGCGNFLIIAYRELRLLELEVVKLLFLGEPSPLDIDFWLKVNIGQFHGFEIEDFPCQIAQIGMWLTDHQMNLRVSESLGKYYARFPMTLNANITHGNALRLDWGDTVPKDDSLYILGNPPFVWSANQSKDQKADILSVYRDPAGKAYEAAGKLDYVVAWYYKAAQFMRGTGIRASFVSTSSIIQGEQVAHVWKPLIRDYGLSIDFAHRPFKWGNEAKGNATVHCVIVGFGPRREVKEGELNDAPKKAIYEGDKKIFAENINPYLVDGPDVFIESRLKPICDAPEMVFGNMPVDGGHFLLDPDELADFLAKEPGASKYVKQIYGAKEYIYGIKRYCFWLEGANPSDLRQLPLLMERIEKVRRFRLSSQRKTTREGASRPSLFQEIRQRTDHGYLIVPSASSDTRKYIPLGFVPPDIVTNNLVLMIPDATLYHFGVLTSNVHMAWVRAVCGRLGNGYRYSKNVVYNNFPWPDITQKRREQIALLAQGVLDARALFPDSDLASLYDPRLTPPPLLDAHKKLDQAVMESYGFKAPESQDEGVMVAKLIVLREKIVGER